MTTLLTKLFLGLSLGLLATVSYGQERSSRLSKQERVLLLRMRSDVRDTTHRDTLQTRDYEDPLAQDFPAIRKKGQHLYDLFTLRYHHWDENDTIMVNGEARPYTEIVNSPDKPIVESYFDITATVHDSVSMLRDHFFLEVDTTFTPTIAPRSTLRLSSPSTATNHDKAIIHYSIRIDSDSLVDVDPRGRLKVALNYLVGYDTIMLNASAKQRPITINGVPFTVERIQDGRISISCDQQVDFFEVWDKVRHMTFDASGRAIFVRSKHDGGEDTGDSFFGNGKGLQSFSRMSFGPERMFSPEGLALSDEEYLQLITQADSAEIAKEETTAVQTVRYDFDTIILFVPRYQRYGSRVLSSQLAD